MPHTLLQNLETQRLKRSQRGAMVLDAAMLLGSKDGTAMKQR